jgi:hypothetical protein
VLKRKDVSSYLITDPLDCRAGLTSRRLEVSGEGTAALVRLLLYDGWKGIGMAYRDDQFLPVSIVWMMELDTAESLRHECSSIAA